jgi:hypothetical protein
MASQVARIGAVAGWIGLLGIFGYHLLLQGLFGPRVSGTLDAAAVTDFYAHDAIAWLGLEQIVVTIPVLVFVVALREVLGQWPIARFWATVGLAVMTAEVALIITEVSIQAALVTAVASGADPLPLFRLWDVLYNSGVYVLEASVLLTFGLAFRAADAFPGWLAGLSFVAAAAIGINAVAIWIGLPDRATLPANLLFAAWFGGTSLVLGRLGRSPVPMAEAASAPAAT